MAVIQDVPDEDAVKSSSRLSLASLLVRLQPPACLPPPHDDPSLVASDELDAFRAALCDAVAQASDVLDGLSQEEGEAAAHGLARWVVDEQAEADEGWVLDARVRGQIKLLLKRLPLPTLLSLKPIFQSSPPPQLSTTSFRALPKPVHHDDVVPELESWRASAGWGCWNVLRLAVEGLDPAAPVPIPVLLPPLLTLLDSTHALTRLRGLRVLQIVIRKTDRASQAEGMSRGWGGEKGKWLLQTGLGEVLMKSLNTTLLLPNSVDVPLPNLHSTTLTAHLSLTLLLYPVNGRARSEALDNLIENGIVSIYTYRAGGELGPDAREIASWLATGVLWDALGSLGTTRQLGALLPPLLNPFSELAFTSERSRAFVRDLLRAARGMLDKASEEAAPRVARWRGRVLDGVGRVWVGLRECEVLPGMEAGKKELDALRSSIADVLTVLRKCSSEVEADLEDLVRLDQTMFEGLAALLS